MKQVKHWQDPVNAVAGAWLIVSPWVLGFQGISPAMWTMVATGIVLGAVALGATFVPKQWEEWTEVALAVWLAASPWLVGFAAMETAMVNAVLVAALILVLALWVLVTDKDYLGSSLNHPAH